MARITLDLPDTFVFTTEIPVTINMINYGGHVGNDAILSVAHEARIRMLVEQGFKELDIDGLGLIMTDTAIVYKAESFHGDILKISVGLRDFNKYGCDIVYHITTVADDKEIARVKTGIVFFDYTCRKVSEIPPVFKSVFCKEAAAL